MFLPYYTVLLVPRDTRGNELASERLATLKTRGLKIIDPSLVVGPPPKPAGEVIPTGYGYPGFREWNNPLITLLLNIIFFTSLHNRLCSDVQKGVFE